MPACLNRNNTITGGHIGWIWFLGGYNPPNSHINYTLDANTVLSVQITRSHCFIFQVICAINQT